jgi:RNA polymerase sigma-70 factor (ECF subfamily)
VTDHDERDRFTDLYRRQHARVFAYAVSHGGRQLAEEVVAETFLVAWRRVDAVPTSHPLPWLLATARNILRERFRDEVRQRSIADELGAWRGTAADVADGVTERAEMLAALAQLSADDRELLTLVAWHGLSAGDAAKVVGCSTATYFVRLHRARRRLEQALSRGPSRPQVPLSSYRQETSS